MNCVVLASGRGSNFEAIAEAVKSGALPRLKILRLISNKADAPALEIAARFGIPTAHMDPKFSRAEGDEWLLKQLHELKPDLILLAGYMRILPTETVEAFPMKIINIHPSLLPAFRGLHAQRQALEAGVRETGCSIHFVTPELDAGPVILQSKIDILPEDTEETLSQRLRPIEHRTYVEALRKLCSQPYSIAGNRVVWGR